MKTTILWIAGLFLLLFVDGCSLGDLATSMLDSTPVPSVTLSVNPTQTPISATTTPGPTLDLASICFDSVPPVFTDYSAWTKINAKPIDGHETKVNIYVDDLARDNYLAASGQKFQPCATIVKTHLYVSSNGSETVTAMTIMMKMPPGFDPDHNDWWWGMYDADGKTAQMSGKVEVCIACHLPQAEVDYVFSKKVLEESK